MYFYWTADVKFLLESWWTHGNIGPYLACLLCTFAVGFVIEFLSTVGVKNDVVRACLHGLRLFLSYMLMLIVMTFNGGLLVAAVAGLTTGYLLFGFKPVVLNIKTMNYGAQQVSPGGSLV